MTVRNPIPMKLQEILSPSFSDQLRRIRAGIAERLLGQPLYVSALLEQRATPAQKARKIDIADLMHESECLGAGTGITP